TGSLLSLTAGMTLLPRSLSKHQPQAGGACSRLSAARTRDPRDQARAWRRGRRLSPLLLAHQLGETLKQIVRVARARGCFGVILHRKHRLAVQRDTAIGAVEQRHMGLCRALGQGRLVNRKTVVHRRDLDFTGGLVLYGMIGAMMTLTHLLGLGTDRKPQHLMAEANAESRCPR